MTFPRSLSIAVRFFAVAATALGLSSTAQATSMSSHTVVFTLDLVSATYEDDGTDAPLESLGFPDSNIGTFMLGTATQSGSHSFTVNGATPPLPDEFDFGVGDRIVATIQADTSADGLGSQATHSRDVIFDIDFEHIDDGFRNILLDFTWSYTQTFSLTNMTAGDQSAVFLDASVLISNFSEYSDSFFFVQDENWGNFTTTPFADTFGDSGSFQLLMDVEEGGATASVVEITIDVGANNIINVPEPTLLTLAASFALLALTGIRRR